MGNTRDGWVGINHYIPAYDSWKWGMLDWKNNINPMASAVRCAWKVTTVSQSYMDELRILLMVLKIFLNMKKENVVVYSMESILRYGIRQQMNISQKTIMSKLLKKEKEKIKKNSVNNLVLIQKNLCSLLLED